MSINTTLAKWDFLAFSMYKWVSKAFVSTCQVTTTSYNQIRWYDRVPADGLDLRDSVLRNPCLLRRRPRSLPLQDPASQGWTRGGLSSIFYISYTFAMIRYMGLRTMERGNSGFCLSWQVRSRVLCSHVPFFLFQGWQPIVMWWLTYSLVPARFDRWSLSFIPILHKKPDRREIDLPGPPM